MTMAKFARAWPMERMSCPLSVSSLSGAWVVGLVFYQEPDWGGFSRCPIDGGLEGLNEPEVRALCDELHAAGMGCQAQPPS